MKKLINFKVNNANSKNSVSLIFYFLKGSKHLFLISIISAAISSLADMITPQIIRITVDNVIGGNCDGCNDTVLSIVNFFGGFSYLKAHLWIMALGLVIVSVLRTVMQYIFRVSNTTATETLVKRMRDILFSHIEHLPFSWHQKNHTGDIIQRCTSDIETLKNFVSEQLTNVFRIVILLVLSITFMLSMNVKLTLIALSPIPIIFGYSLLFFGKISNAYQECDENEGILSTMAQENLTGVRIVRAFGREKYERERFEKHNEYYTSKWSSLANIMSFYWSSQDVLSGIEVMLVVVFGAFFCIKSVITTGEYIAFISYNTMLVWPVRSLGRMISEMSKAGVSVSRINYIMNSKTETDKPDAIEPSLNGDIKFDHVSFAYEGCAEVLHDISFTMKAGSTLGILGSTGSGKSTITLLLDKMYDLPLTNGSISIGGIDIRNIKTGWLRKNISIVLQEPFLFSKSIKENITITADNDIPLKLKEATEAACLESTIESFSNGYDTFVGERGVTLSGGQKQRTAIARALIANTPIIIFDDSLSAVDTETELKIRKSLESKFGTASIIIISHRISTLSKADKIIVLDKGIIVEQGTHADLINNNGVYSQICNIQQFKQEDTL